MLLVLPASTLAAASPHSRRGVVRPVSARLTAAPGPLSASKAEARARSTGKPVVAAALTTPTSLTTAHPDGTFSVTQSAKPMRAWRKGSWVALDPALHDNGSTVAPAVTASPLGLSAGGTGPLATMTDAGRTFSLSWPTTLPAPTLAGATATYPDVLPGVDLIVTADTDGGFSDTLVVRNATAAANPALASLSMIASAPGLSLAVAPSGGLTVAASSAAEPLFAAEAPLVWDSAPPPAGTATITGPDGTTVDAQSGLPAASSADQPGAGAHVAAVPLSVGGDTITMSPPAAALTGPGVVYPVYIDPTWYPTSSNRSTWTQVDSAWPTTSYWKESSDLQIGLCDWSDCNSTFTARSFVTLPVPSALNSASVVNAAYLYTTDDWAPSCTATAGQLWATTAISSATTWSNQPTWQTEIQQQSFAYGYSSSCAAQDTDVTWNITSIMQRDAGSASNQTFGLRAASESTDTQWKQFRHGSSHQLYLTVYYNDPPNKPSARSTNPGGSCHYSASSAPAIGNDDVTFSAAVSDNDGDNNLTTRFIILNSNGTTAYDSAQQGTSFVSGNKSTASLLLRHTAIQAWHSDGATQAYTYHWYAMTTDSNSLINPRPADDCYFTYNPVGPAVPTVSPDSITGQIGQAVSVSFAPPATGCGQASTPPCPASYTYQLGATPPVTVIADSIGDWTGTIPLRRIGPMLLTVYAADSAGNLSGDATVSATGNPPTKPYADGDLTGDGEPDLLTVGTTSEPGLWLSTGSGPGTVHRAVDIGGTGTSINAAGGPGDWSGAQVLHGNFTADGVQDVMAYYPSGTHAGAGQIIGGTGDGSMLQPYTGNVLTIHAGALTDPFFGNPDDSPLKLVAAGNASQLSAGGDDLIGILGDPTSGYELDLYSIAGLTGSNRIGGYGYDTTLSTQAPDGTSDWNNYTLTTAQSGGSPSAIVLFALDTATGTFYESTNPTASATALIGTPGTWTQLTVPWGTSPPALASADVNANGQTELWAATGTTATAYTLSGATLTQEAADALSPPSHEWPIAEGSGSTADDTTDASPATLTGTASWTDPDSGDIFAPALTLDGSSNALATSGPAVNTAQSYTVSAWVKLADAPGSTAPAAHNQAAVAQGGTEDSGFYLGYNYAHSGGWSFYFANGDTANPAFTGAYGTPAAAGTWTHLVGVYNATTQTATLYVNGSQAASVAFTTAWNATGPLTIGRSRYNGGTADYLTGTVADVQTWPTALTAAQAAATGGITGSGPVQSAITGKCLDDWHNGTADGTIVDIYDCNGTAPQDWTVDPGDTLQLNGKCLDVTGGGTANHTLVDLSACTGSTAQQWTPGPGGSLINAGSGKCLDDPGATTTNGTQLQIYTCNTTSAQNWALP